VLTQIKLQLEAGLIPVPKVHDPHRRGAKRPGARAVGGWSRCVEPRGEPRATEALRLAGYRIGPQIVDATTEELSVFEITGKPSKIDSFIAIMGCRSVWSRVGTDGGAGGRIFARGRRGICSSLSFSDFCRSTVGPNGA